MIKPRYCCERFKESVETHKIIEKATQPDETVWFLNEGGHIITAHSAEHLLRVRASETTMKSILHSGNF